MTDLTNRNTFGQVNAGISGFGLLNSLPSRPPSQGHLRFLHLSLQRVTLFLAITPLLYPHEPRPQFSL